MRPGSWLEIEQFEHGPSEDEIADVGSMHTPRLPEVEKVEKVEEVDAF